MAVFETRVTVNARTLAEMNDVPPRAARSAARRGLEHALLADVALGAVEASTRIGCRGLLVHAEDDAARGREVAAPR